MIEINRDFLIIAGAGFAAMLLAGPLAAQDQAQEDTNWVDITTWDQASLYEGFSAEELIDEEVYGTDGDSIGEVEDFIIESGGQISSVVVEGGGFLDIGDSHIVVPWSEVERSSDSISVPVNEGNIGEYGMFEHVDDADFTGERWRLSNLMGDYVTLEDASYGYVRDVIFNQDGEIHAVVANPAYGYGYPTGVYGIPYNDAAYDPFTPTYDTPYTRVQMEKLAPMNYSNID